MAVPSLVEAVLQYKKIGNVLAVPSLIEVVLPNKKMGNGLVLPSLIEAVPHYKKESEMDCFPSCNCLHYKKRGNAFGASSLIWFGLF